MDLWDRGLGSNIFCRDKLGVVTRAFFNQLDFTETGILVDFYNTLEMSLRTQLTESGFYMGTSMWVTHVLLLVNIGMFTSPQPRTIACI